MIVMLVGQGLTMELEALLEAAAQFTQEILKLSLDALKENHLPHSQFTKVTKQVTDSEAPLQSMIMEEQSETADGTLAQHRNDYCLLSVYSI